jgi:hypothetical protein
MSLRVVQAKERRCQNRAWLERKMHFQYVDYQLALRSKILSSGACIHNRRFRGRLISESCTQTDPHLAVSLLSEIAACSALCELGRMSVGKDPTADQALHAMLAVIRYAHTHGLSMAPHLANAMSCGTQGKVDQTGAGCSHRLQQDSGLDCQATAFEQQSKNGLPSGHEDMQIRTNHMYHEDSILERLDYRPSTTVDSNRKGTCACATDGPTTAQQDDLQAIDRGTAPSATEQHPIGDMQGRGMIVKVEHCLPPCEAQATQLTKAGKESSSSSIGQLGAAEQKGVLDCWSQQYTVSHSREKENRHVLGTVRDSDGNLAVYTDPPQYGLKPLSFGTNRVDQVILPLLTVDWSRKV